MIEVRDVRQNPNEQFRRWFSDDNFDLIVWYMPDEIVYGFELSYDRDDQEKVLRWFSDRGLSHYSVDRAPYLNRAEMLVKMNGQSEMARVLSCFRTVDQSLPIELKTLVCEKIEEYGQLGIRLR